MTDRPSTPVTSTTTDKPTLPTVAERAGVSLGTASHVFSNKSGVLPETRAKVMDAASALGYQPAPRSIAPNTMDRTTISTIGLLVKSSADDRPALNAFSRRRTRVQAAGA